MRLDRRERLFQFATAKHVSVEVSSSVRVWAKDATAERLLKELQRLDVSSVHFHLERRLLPIARE